MRPSDYAQQRTTQEHCVTLIAQPSVLSTGLGSLRLSRQQLLNMRNDGGNRFHQLVAARFIERAWAAIGIGDFATISDRHKFAKQPQLARYGAGLQPNHRTMSLGHAQDEQRGIEHRLRERLALVRGNIDAHFF